MKLARLDGCSWFLIGAVVLALAAGLIGGAKWIYNYGAEPIDNVAVAGADATVAPTTPGNPAIENAVRSYYSDNFQAQPWYPSILNVKMEGSNLWVRTSVDPNTTDGQEIREHICGASRAMRPFVTIPGNIYVLDRTQRDLCIV